MKQAKELCQEAKRYLKSRGFKSSVSSKDGHVDVYILSGPVDFIQNHIDKKESEHRPVYEGYIQDHHMQDVSIGDYFTGAALEIIEAVKSIIVPTEGGHDDSDYGFISAWYYTLGIGKWDQPYVYIPVETTKEEEKETASQVGLDKTTKKVEEIKKARDDQFDENIPGMRAAYAAKLAKNAPVDLPQIDAIVNELEKEMEAQESATPVIDVPTIAAAVVEKVKATLATGVGFDDSNSLCGLESVVREEYQEFDVNDHEYIMDEVKELLEKSGIRLMQGLPFGQEWYIHKEKEYYTDISEEGFFVREK